MRELFEVAQGPMMRFFFRLCRSAEQAEDLTQNTFLKLWSYRGQYRGTGQAKSYIYRIALNEWRNGFTRERRRNALKEEWHQDMEPEENTSPSSRIEAEETRVQLMAAVEALPDGQRETFILHRFEGLNCREIAESQGYPQKTVESRLRLALEKLTRRLRMSEGLA